MTKIKHIYVVMCQHNDSCVIENQFQKSGSRLFIYGIWGEKPIYPNIDIRNTTWSEGRNKLLEHVLKHYDFDYISFVDDDLYFTLGSLNDYEHTIEKYKLPVYHTLDCPTPKQEQKREERLFGLEQRKKNKDIYFCDRVDTNFITFRKDLINELLPWISEFDNKSWWYSAILMVYKIQSKKIVPCIVLSTETHNRLARPYPRHGDLLSKEIIEYVKNNYNYDKPFSMKCQTKEEYFDNNA